MGGKTSTTTQKVEIPPEVMARYNAVNTRAESVAGTPFRQYSTDPSDFVAQLNNQQIAGINQVNQAAGAYQPFFQGATAATMAGMGSANPAELDVGKYMNPYQQSVIDATMRQMNQANEQAQSGALGTAISSGAFGGDRAGIAAANLANQQGMAMGSTLAGLNAQNYEQALAASQQQQGVQLGAEQANLARLMQGGQSLAGLGSAYQQAGLQGAEAMINAGTLGQQTEQAGKTALYNQFQQQQAYPFQVAQFLANIAMGTGALSGSTTTTTQPSSFWSDRRLKHDIQRIGKTDEGLPIYKFKYKGDPDEQTHIGFMADEVEDHHPEAVGVAPNGYKYVDYDRAAKAGGGGVAGPYGLSVGSDNPYAAGYVPQAYLPVGELMIADSSGLQNADQSMAQQIDAAASFGNSLADLKKNFGKGGEYWMTNEQRRALEAQGEKPHEWRGGVVGYATGGTPGYLDERTKQEQSPVSKESYLSDTVKSQEEGKKNQLMQPGAAPGQQQSGASQLAGLLGGAGAAMQGFAAIAPLLGLSDRRAKHDIKRIGKTDDGMPIYKFKYKGDDREQTHIGFMADEVEDRYPEAVSTGPDGLKRVDYSQAHKFYQGGVVRPAYADGGDIERMLRARKAAEADAAVNASRAEAFGVPEDIAGRGLIAGLNATPTQPVGPLERPFGEAISETYRPIRERAADALSAAGMQSAAAVERAASFVPYGLGFAASMLGAPGLGQAAMDTGSDMAGYANERSDWATKYAQDALFGRDPTRWGEKTAIVAPLAPVAPTVPVEEAGVSGASLPPSTPPVTPAAPIAPVVPAGVSGGVAAAEPAGLAPLSSPRPQARPAGLAPATEDYIGPRVAPKPGEPMPLPGGVADGSVPAVAWEYTAPKIRMRESGNDYNALYGHANREGGPFAGKNVTEMTVDEALAFADPSGPYGQYVASTRPDSEYGVATPLGAYGIVGSTLEEIKKGMGLTGNEIMTPELQDQMAGWLYAKYGERPWASSAGNAGAAGAGVAGGVAGATGVSAPAAGATGVAGPRVRASDKPWEDRTTLGKMFYDKDGAVNKDALLSILSGIGAMASSPSRYLGASILQGIGGAANTYAALQKQAADIGLTNAQANETQVRADASRFVEFSNGMMMVVLGPGRAVPMTDFLANPQMFSTGDPERDAQILAAARAAAANPSLAAGGQGAFGNTNATMPTGVRWGQASQDALARANASVRTQSGFMNYGANTKEVAALVGQANEASMDALTAKPNGNELAYVVGGAINDGSMGSVQGRSAVLRNVLAPLNSVLRTMGVNIDTLDDPQTQALLLDKMSKLSTEGLMPDQQRAASVFNEFVALQPNLEMTPEAAAIVTASMMLQNQEAIDRANYYRAFQGAAAAGFAPNDMTQGYANEYSPIRQAEKENLTNLFLLASPTIQGPDGQMIPNDKAETVRKFLSAANAGIMSQEQAQAILNTILGPENTSQALARYFITGM